MCCCSCFPHFSALLKKNFILWRRNWCQSILEILIPILFALLFGTLKYIIPSEELVARSFASSSSLYNLPTVIDSSWVPTQSIPTASGSLQIVPKLKNCPNAKTKGNTIALIPNNALTQAIKSQLELGYKKLAAVPAMQLDDSKISYKFFDTRQDLVNYINNPLFSLTIDSLCFAVVFNTSQGVGKYNYELMFNISNRNENENDFVNPALNTIDLLSREDIESSLIDYYSSGYLTLQSIINNLLVQETYGSSSAKIQAKIQSVQIPAYTKGVAAGAFIQAGDVFLAFPLLWPFLRFVAYLIEDKERRVKEGMTMMGMSETAFFFSYFVFYLMVFTIISIIASIFVVTTIASGTSYVIYLIWYWLFTISLMATAYFVSAFFSRVRPGTVFALIVFLIFYLLSNIINIDTAPKRQKAMIAFFSPISNLYMGMQIILSLAAIGSGLTRATMQTDFNNFSITNCLAISVISSVFYFVLGAYIERVWPRQYGIRKHPLYCVLWCFKRRGRNGAEKLKPLYQEENQNLEPVDEALKLQDKNGESLIVRELRKVYSNKKVAVDGVSMTMYKGQIFALLGHNGAGKTSLISVLTGLYPATKGDATIFGMDIRTEMDQIRKRLGVCPQHDILFPKLTIREHLKLFATFKGMENNIDDEIDKMIKDMDLWEKKDDLAMNLSGGQKRRLSVGIALIGNSDIILLDEPSSGMDTSARRSLWEMLKNYKNNRIIILTTHFMDEADFLGDRIGIMGKGHLITCGRSLFLKNKFGVGYHLTLVKKDTLADSGPIIDLIKKHIPEAQVISNVSAEIGMQLPSQTTTKFSSLFQELDSLKESLGISNYGISVTTLDEVFLKVAELEAGHDDSKQQKKALPQNNNLFVETRPQGQEAQSKEDNSPNSETKALKNFDKNGEIDEERIGGMTLYRTHFLALILKKWHFFKRDKKGFCCEIFLPIIIMIVGLIIMKRPVILDAPIVPLNPATLWPQPVNVMYNKIMPSNTALSANLISLLDQNVTLTSSSAQSLASFDSDLLAKALSFDPSLRMSFFIETEDTIAYNWDFTTLINSTARQAAPLSINYMSTAILQQKDPSYYINHALTTLPLTAVQNLRTNGLVNGIIAAYLFTMALSFVGASLVYFMVKESETNAKHQQIVSGVSISAYWMSSYLIDVLKYLLPGIIGPLLVAAFDVSTLKDNTCWSATWSLFLLYGTANISFSYMLTFIFKTAGGGQIGAFFINIIIGIIGSSVLATLRFFPSTKAAGSGIAWIFRVFPSFCFANGMFLTTSRPTISLVEGWYPYRDAIDIQLAGGDVLFLGIDTIFYLAVVFLLEYMRSRQITFSKVFGKEQSVKYQEKSWDDDVANENRRVLESSSDKYSLKVQEIRKVYLSDPKKPNVAVDKISFGVEKGEVFALLGINGAGKTTTFKIMSGEIPASEGKVFIKGFDISKDMSKARKFIGYCPQFDALLDNLTSKEHLQLFAAIKGIPEKKRKKLIDQKIKEVGLETFKDIPAGTYSGGNKRKLSFAIATIGNPPIVFLDEPSTGMDPESRRFMWKVISNISTKSKMSSIVLTTHSMEEAEALTTRMAIQVDGMIKCLGSIQHIKSKFGAGFEMEFKQTTPDKNMIQHYLNELGLHENNIIQKNQVAGILDKMRASWVSDGLTAKGFGSAIFNELEKGELKAGLFIEFILIEISGDKLTKFLKQSFGGVSLIEHFQTFYRFKVVTDAGIGVVFGKIEEQLKNHSIAQYSVGQTTIEQIFNLFATRKLPAPIQKHQSHGIDLSQSPDLIPQNPVKEINLEMVKENK